MRSFCKLFRRRLGNTPNYRLGNTTLNQLKTNGIIPMRSYGQLDAKKPDGLVIYQGRVRAVVEYKQPKELSKVRDVEAAISQEIDVAKALCKILIVTDSTKSYWVNALNGDFIKDNRGEDLRTVFHPFTVKDVSTIKTKFKTLSLRYRRTVPTSLQPLAGSKQAT